MSASTDRDRFVAAARAPAMLQTAALLVGLAVGLWPQRIFPSKSPAVGGALATLQALAVSHVIFLVVIWPLVSMRRSPGQAMRLGRVVLAAAVHVLIAVPFYVAAAWLADAGPADVIRTAVYLAVLAPLGWAAGAYMGSGRAGGSWILLAMLLLAAGLPAAHYIAREFLAGAGDAGWLWSLGPATGVWDVAASRGGSVVPRPVWPLAVYLVAAAALALVRAAIGKKANS